MDSRGTSRKTIHGSHNDRKTQRRTNNPMCNRRPSLSTRTLVPVVPGTPIEADCGGVPEAVDVRFVCSFLMLVMSDSI